MQVEELTLDRGIDDSERKRLTSMVDTVVTCSFVELFVHLLVLVRWSTYSLYVSADENPDAVNSVVFDS